MKCDCHKLQQLLWVMWGGSDDTAQIKCGNQEGMYKVTTIVEGDKNRRVMIEQQVTAQNECQPWLN
jgi:phage gp37-like protein